MTLKNKPQLLYDATVIRHETADYHNTAERVGVMFVDLINSIDYSFEGIADIIDGSVQDALADLDLSGVGGSVDLSSYATRSWVQAQGYLTELPDMSVYVTASQLADYATKSLLNSYLPKATFDEMFEKVVTGVDADGNEIWYIHAKRSVASVGDFVGYEEDGSLSGGGGVGASSLGDLTDVLLTSLSAGDVLTWNGFKWVNAAASSGGLDESALASYLTTNNYITADYLTNKFVRLTGDKMTGMLSIASSVGDDFNEGIRIHTAPQGWASLVFCGIDNTGDIGTSANTWSICTNNGNFGIGKNGNGILSGDARLWCDTSNNWHIKNNLRIDHAGEVCGVRFGTSDNDDFVGRSTSYLTLWNETAQAELKIHDNGTFDFSGGNNLIFNNNTIWHAGNDGYGSGLDADLLDGYHNGQITAINVNYCSDENKPSSVQFMQKASGWNGWDAPSQNWFTTIKMNHGDGDNYFHRTLSFDFFSHRIYSGCMQGGSHIGWKTLAFLDDNVASATKLQTARNIFGISFNGENDVDGAFTQTTATAGVVNGYTNNGFFRCPNPVSNEAVNITFGKSQGLYNLGYIGHVHVADGSASNYVTIGGFAADRILNVLYNGNVGIGTTNPQAKLHVNGDMITNGDYFYQGVDGTLAIYSMPNPGMPSEYYSETVVIQTAFDQQDPRTSTYPLSWQDRTVLALQPRGGRVGVGTAAPQAPLHVAGNILAEGDVVGYNTSDRRLKTNVRAMNNSLAMLRNLGGYYTFDYTDDAPEGEKCERIGLIFQNVASSGHLGELMSHVADNGYGALNYIKADYINLIGASVLEVDDEVMRLKSRVAELEVEIGHIKLIA